MKDLTNYHAGIKLLRQIEHLQKMVEIIVSFVMIHDLDLCQLDAPATLRALSLEGEVQNDVDNFIINIERFNELAKQSKMAIPQNFGEIAKELKEANQPILNHLAALKNEIANDIKKSSFRI